MSRKTGGLASGSLGQAVSILGDKWTPRLIHALAGGALRFCRLQAAAGGVNPRTLCSRLEWLEGEGILSKVVVSQFPPHTSYSLTAKGRDLLPILQEMASWSAKYTPAAEGGAPATGREAPGFVAKAARAAAGRKAGRSPA
ncbi:MAG TPA: helix-turn-helix domain-containing protein [Spirochaetia bacterium]|nr:helix-turn-helix domain-containing protein [Spirochaetia bacterium]